MYCENGITRGVKYPKNRGTRGVPLMDNTPGDMDNIGKECRLPLVYIIPLRWNVSITFFK